MSFDIADVSNMIANHDFGTVVMHEMGHIIGMYGQVALTLLQPRVAVS